MNAADVKAIYLAAARQVPTARIIRADTHPPMVVDSVSGWRMGYNENRNLYIYTNMSNPNLRYWQCPTRRLAYVWEIHEFRARERLYFDPTEDENNEENNEEENNEIEDENNEENANANQIEQDNDEIQERHLNPDLAIMIAQFAQNAEDVLEMRVLLRNEGQAVLRVLDEILQERNFFRRQYAEALQRLAPQQQLWDNLREVAAQFRYDHARLLDYTRNRIDNEILPDPVAWKLYAGDVNVVPRIVYKETLQEWDNEELNDQYTRLENGVLLTSIQGEDINELRNFDRRRGANGTFQLFHAARSDAIIAEPHQGATYIFQFPHGNNNARSVQIEKAKFAMRLPHILNLHEIRIGPYGGNNYDWLPADTEEREEFIINFQRIVDMERSSGLHLQYVRDNEAISLVEWLGYCFKLNHVDSPRPYLDRLLQVLQSHESLLDETERRRNNRVLYRRNLVDNNRNRIDEDEDDDENDENNVEERIEPILAMLIDNVVRMVDNNVEQLAGEDLLAERMDGLLLAGNNDIGVNDGDMHNENAINGENNAEEQIEEIPVIPADNNEEQHNNNNNNNNRNEEYVELEGPIRRRYNRRSSQLNAEQAHRYIYSVNEQSPITDLHGLGRATCDEIRRTEPNIHTVGDLLDDLEHFRPDHRFERLGRLCDPKSVSKSFIFHSMYHLIEERGNERWPLDLLCVDRIP